MTELTSPQRATHSEENLTGGFVYESEHPQLQMPFSARITGRRLEGKSLSVTEAHVSGLIPPNSNLEGNTIALQFDFEGFTLSLFLLADIEKIGDSDNPDYCLRFCDPSASHLAPLRYILNSHLAGDLVTMDRFLGYTGPTKAKHKTPPTAPTKMQKFSRGLRKLCIAASSVGLIAIASNVIHDRFVFSYEPRPVVIGQGGEILRATSAGQITYTNNQAGQSDVIYSISANSGDLLSVRMPCDCDIQPLADYYEGATILAGTPLVRLVSDDVGIDAQTFISPEGAARIISGDTAELKLANGNVLPVEVTLIEQSLGAGGQTDEMMAAKLTLSDIDETQVQVGDIARLRFRRDIVPDALVNRIKEISNGI
ncbi:MAG: hypothetical protein ABJN34_03670 [Litoreibacter sp.]|uniref:hypothetical protein n=1 Tax=Litoreibacter sp. TaxID=1969459 RepID=UPI0032984AE2